MRREAATASGEQHPNFAARYQLPPQKSKYGQRVGLKKFRHAPRLLTQKHGSSPKARLLREPASAYRAHTGYGFYISLQNIVFLPNSRVAIETIAPDRGRTRIAPDFNRGQSVRRVTALEEQHVKWLILWKNT